MIIKNGKIILPDRIVDGSVVIRGGKIEAVLDSSDFTDDEVFDAKGCYVSPGFVDIHCHGGGGVDFLDGDPFDKPLEFHMMSGTTSMLASALTSPADMVVKFCEQVREEMKLSPVDKRRARLLGAHIEGPYLSKSKRGAQPEEYLLTPSKDNYDFLLNNADVIKTVTIAPELDGADKMVADMVKSGIVVCGGHDDGRKSQFIDAVEAGVTHLTHLWCAMSLVGMYDGTREVGLCEYGLSNDNISVEIIADNHHMTPELVKIVYRCKGSRKMCVVSDCLRGGGIPAGSGKYVLGNKDEKYTEFLISDGVARLLDNTHLAGSIQPVGQMVKNMVNDCGIPLCDAVRMASLTPAQVIKSDGVFGSIEAGKYADICILDDTLTPTTVFINGEIIYQKG